jgi:hypothetical protein
MSIVWRIPVRSVRKACMAAFSLFVSSSILAQSPTPASATGQSASAAPTGQPACVQLADEGIPLNATIQAKITGVLNSGHLKPGKDIWVNSTYGMIFPNCRFEADAAIYGRVIAASSSKNPNSSELALQFDRVDCAGHNKQSMKLFLIGVIAPPEESGSLHDSVPTEVHGGARQVSETVAGTNAYDARLNPGGAANTVKPGAVVGFKNLKLEPQGGPECSARMSSTNRSIELGPGTTLILAPNSSQ